MKLGPNLRKLTRTIHVTVTVGWLGAVAGFLALAIVGLNSQDRQLVSAVYLSMDIITRYVIVPLSLVPLLLTGPLLSLGTPWGLFRHYWIVVKLVINVLSTLILLVHLRPIEHMAHIAAAGTISSADRGAQIQLVVAAAAGLLAFLAATALAVYKPRAMTVYGWRKQYKEHTKSPNSDPADQ
jgi:hypothetical protein